MIPRVRPIFILILVFILQMSTNANLISVFPERLSSGDAGSSDTHVAKAVSKNVARGQMPAFLNSMIGRQANSVPINESTRPFPGNTLISDDPNRQILEVDPYGNVTWRLRLDYPRNATGELIYDVERLPNNNILVACSLYAAGEIIEFNRSGEVVWSYKPPTPPTMAPHDVDRIDSGNTLFTDTWNSVVYEVNPEGIIVWKWDANDHLGFLRPPESGSNWAHINDADRLIESGNTLISLRNLDMVVEVDPFGEIVWSYGQKDNHSLLFHQHDPDRLPSGTTLIADSENNRIVEINTTTKEVVWMYEGTLNWPRDADRLPGGTTLITDSLNRRVIEVTADGAILWEWYSSAPASPRGIYDADRLDIEPPTISIESPVNKTYPSSTIAVILSSTTNDLDSIWFHIHDDTKGVWTTSDNVSWVNDAFIVLEDGQYTLLVFANDTQYGDRHSNTQQLMVTFLIDTISPQVLIESPIPQTYDTNTVDVVLLAIDSNLNDSWYRIFCDSRNVWIDEANVTYSRVESRVLEDGQYSLFAWAIDSGGNLNETVTTFTIETGAPVVSIDSPSETTYFGEVLVQLSCVCNDWDQLWYRLATTDANSIETWYDPHNISYSDPEQRNLEPGSYVLHAFANDFFGNVQFPPTKVRFTVISLAEMRVSFADSQLPMVILLALGSSGLGVFTRFRKKHTCKKDPEKGSRMLFTTRIST